MESTLKFIGQVHSTLKRKEDCPLQEYEDSPSAELEIFADYVKGIGNISIGSEILLLTWLHAGDRSVIECVPRNNFDAPKIGVFSTRSPDRPNPIGLHTVSVTGISGQGFLIVSGLEVLDGTPLIDIKPVLKNRSIG
jgi:tRNA-Thr(GGU) m(6)t(6)A37 methyltransferase TsaA